MKQLFKTYLLLISFLFHVGLFSEPLSENEYVKAIHAHLRIKDFQSAQQEALEALNLLPHSKPLWEAYIKVLAKQGNEKEMVSTWKSYVEVFPEEKKNRDLIEILAWGVIDHASQSSSPIIRVMSLLSAFLSQDAKGIEIFLRYFRDPNSAIRGIAAQLSSNLRDAVIQDEIYRLFKQETVWDVRLEAIRSIGSMKMRKAHDELMALLQDPKTTAEETAAIIEALIEIWERPNRQGVAALIQGNRAGLRLLGCQVIAHFEMKDDIDLLVPLIDDHHAEVRKNALWVLGYLRIKELNGIPIEKIAQKKLSDIDPLVGVKAAWLITLNDPLNGQKAFVKWFDHQNKDVQVMAAAHLSASGRYAFPLILEQFKNSKNPYVRMNLALGLLGQRSEIQSACQALYEGLGNLKEKWTWDEKSKVRALIPSKIKHKDDLMNSPEAIDQLTRLEILNILAVMKFPQAQQAIKTFLQQKTWGITATATATLLTEGDEEALGLVHQLMNDPEMNIRVQAALIFAMWGGGEVALGTLEKAYFEVDREMKEHILEGIAKISSPLSIPFLLDRLQEPNQSLRVMAAAGLVLCLYH